jgi:hypothetical protein
MLNTLSGEAFQGPKVYTQDDQGSHSAMVGKHLGKRLDEAKRKRWMAGGKLESHGQKWLIRSQGSFARTAHVCTTCNLNLAPCGLNLPQAAAHPQFQLRKFTTLA